MEVRLVLDEEIFVLVHSSSTRCCYSCRIAYPSFSPASSHCSGEGARRTREKDGAGRCDFARLARCYLQSPRALCHNHCLAVRRRCRGRPALRTLHSSTSPQRRSHCSSQLPGLLELPNGRPVYRLASPATPPPFEHAGNSDDYLGARADPGGAHWCVLNGSASFLVQDH